MAKVYLNVVLLKCVVVTHTYSRKLLYVAVSMHCIVDVGLKLSVFVHEMRYLELLAHVNWFLVLSSFNHLL